MKYKSSLLSLLFFGDNPIIDILTPYRIYIEESRNIITVSKRNTYLIGVDKWIIPFKNIRSLNIDEHFFGADLHVKVYGAPLLVVKCLSKADARRASKVVLGRMGRNSVNIS